MKPKRSTPKNSETKNLKPNTRANKKNDIALNRNSRISKLSELIHAVKNKAETKKVYTDQIDEFEITSSATSDLSSNDNNSSSANMMRRLGLTAAVHHQRIEKMETELKATKEELRQTNEKLESALTCIENLQTCLISVHQNAEIIKGMLLMYQTPIGSMFQTNQSFYYATAQALVTNFPGLPMPGVYSSENYPILQEEEPYHSETYPSPPDEELSPTKSPNYSPINTPTKDEAEYLFEDHDQGPSEQFGM